METRPANRSTTVYILIRPRPEGIEKRVTWKRRGKTEKTSSALLNTLNLILIGFSIFINIYYNFFILFHIHRWARVFENNSVKIPELLGSHNNRKHSPTPQIRKKVWQSFRNLHKSLFQRHNHWCGSSFWWRGCKIVPVVIIKMNGPTAERWNTYPNCET